MFSLFNFITKPKGQYVPVVNELKRWILADKTRTSHFNQAITSAQSYHIHDMPIMTSLEDLFHFLDSNLLWIPSEKVLPNEAFIRQCTLSFILEQPAVKAYQSPITPWTADGDSKQADDLSWLSSWIVRYHNELGRFMDSPASATAIHTFRTNPSYHLDDYLEPRGGWSTFNQFFARNLKPGRRPIASIGDETVITSPADFEFKEQHSIAADSTITTKGVTWPIQQMLSDSPYKHRFANGTWLHGFLNVNDYHRIHTPVSGTVVEARTILGQNSLQVQAKPTRTNKDKDKNCIHNVIDVLSETGFQFCQARGLVILDTGRGLVAVLPVGMTSISSVNLTAEVGVQLQKGEEVGYFQFGGSDVVLIFEEGLNVGVSMEEGVHYQMGMEIGRFE